MFEVLVSEVGPAGGPAARHREHWHHGGWEEGGACDCAEMFSSFMVARKGVGSGFPSPLRGTPPVTYFLSLGSASSTPCNSAVVRGPIRAGL